MLYYVSMCSTYTNLDIHLSIQVLMRREDDSVDFNREWEDYKSGFGDVTGSFWAGKCY
jgi:hypothetical protein